MLKLVLKARAGDVSRQYLWGKMCEGVKLNEVINVGSLFLSRRVNSAFTQERLERRSVRWAVVSAQMWSTCLMYHWLELSTGHKTHLFAMLFDVLAGRLNDCIISRIRRAPAWTVLLVHLDRKSVV